MQISRMCTFKVGGREGYQICILLVKVDIRPSYQIYVFLWMPRRAIRSIPSSYT
jgi:hypothetical protein